MIVGVPKEVKSHEYRVAIVPAGAEALTRAGHTLLVQHGAGEGSGISDSDYIAAGAQIVQSPEEVYRRSEMMVKVKEPLEQEYPLLRHGQLVFTFFHFAASRELTTAMLAAGIRAVAYEMVRTEDGGHPLLTPMSEVAGRMAVQEGAKYLERPMGGRGVLLAGVPGVRPAEVVIIGGGVVGSNAARIAAGMGACVTILEIDQDRMRYLDDIMPPNVTTLMSNAVHLREAISRADLVIGAVLVEGARAPVLLARSDLRLMKPGALIVDVAVDQGGCFETTHPTTHDAPVYEVDGILHYCVTNMPGAVGITSTYALTNATFPYVLALADKGIRRAACDDVAVLRGISMYEGHVTCAPVAEAFGLECRDARKLLGMDRPSRPS